MIAQWQIEQFHQQGFLVVEEVLSAEEVALLQTDFDAWVEESRQHSEAWAKPWTAVRASTSKAITRRITPRCAG